MCVSVSIPGWPWISCVVEDDLGLLILDLPSAGFINVCCHPVYTIPGVKLRALPDRQALYRLNYIPSPFYSYLLIGFI